MTELVTCRVCGFESPLGTVECPECGAPLPTKIEPPVTAEPPSPAAQPLADETAVDAPAEKRPFKLRPVHLVAGLLAICLLIPLVLLVRPKKEPLPGAIATGNGFITQNGVWDIESEGLIYVGGRSYTGIDGTYYLLGKKAESGDLIGDGGTLRGTVYSSSSSSLYYFYNPEIEQYYLFDGCTLEPLEADEAAMRGDVVFYLQREDGQTTLYRRDLARGETATVDTFPGEGKLADYRYAADGSAVVYSWGEGADATYRLWRRGSRKPMELKDLPGSVTDVGTDGKTFLLWKGAMYTATGAYVNGSEQQWLWRDGTLLDLPAMELNSCNNTHTQFLFRDLNYEDYTGEWYYYAPDETDQPVRLEVDSGAYCYPILWWHTEQTSLKGHFYQVYNNDGDGLYYLADDLTFLPVAEGEVGNYSLAADGKTMIYLQNGDLYRAAVDSSGTLAVTPLTNTAEESGSSKGTVSSFAASEDLKHVYYMDWRSLYSEESALHYWHDGEDTALDFSPRTNYVSLTVTNDGACYVTHTRDLYYTEKGSPPQLLLEEVGTNASIRLVGETKWPLLIGTRWEDSQNKTVYWLLDGNRMPVELEEWRPEEGTL